MLMLENSKIIKQHRQKIDKIDKMIIKLLHKRFETVKEIAKYKNKQKLPVFSRKREQEAIIKRCALATDINIRPIFIKTMFKQIFKESRHIQRKLIKKTCCFDKNHKI